MTSYAFTNIFHSQKYDYKIKVNAVICTPAAVKISIETQASSFFIQQAFASHCLLAIVKILKWGFLETKTFFFRKDRSGIPIVKNLLGREI